MEAEAAGSTWGDWGDDDELGRVNLITPEKVLQGVREVEAGLSFCLSLPLDYPGGTVAQPAPIPTGGRPYGGHEGGAGDLLQRAHERNGRLGRPAFVDVWADDVVTLSLQYSTQWDSLAHVGAEFDADGDGVEEAVYYNGYRAGVDLVGPEGPTPAAMAAAIGRSPITSGSSTWRSTESRGGGC